MRSRHGLMILGTWLLFSVAACSFLIVRCDPAFRHHGGASLLCAIALNALPALVVLMFLLGLTRRPLLSTWMVLVTLGTLYFIDAQKTHELGTPLMPGDALLLTNLGADGAALLLRYVPTDFRHVGAALACVAITVLLIWREKPLSFLRAWHRVVLLVITLTLATTLYLGTVPWRSLYMSAGGEEFQAWSPQEQALHTGLLAHLLRFRWATAGDLPKPDIAVARALLQRYQGELSAPASATTALPDIVILQSESFFDAARLRGLAPESVIPNYRRLAALAQHGNLWVPTFGGGTIRTEFEVLTGIAMRYFPATQYPYFRLTATPIPSIASVLAARGYRTLAVHPHARSFWNRAAALANMGFQSFDAEERFTGAPKQGYYTSDDALVDHILKRLDDSSRPTLVFAISMENHGPYANYPNVDEARRAAEPAPAGLSSDAQGVIRGYLYHAENADRALGKLAAALRARPRRSLLLFYGDHLPALPEVYAEVGFDDGAAAYVQPVPWMLLDTADVSPHTATDTAAFYLPGLLLDTAGIDDDYFHLLAMLARSDHPGEKWIPAENKGLAAIMRLRQRGEFNVLATHVQKGLAPSLQGIVDPRPASDHEKRDRGD